MSRPALQPGEIGEVTLALRERTRGGATTKMWRARCMYVDQTGKKKHTETWRAGKKQAKDSCAAQARELAGAGNSELGLSDPFNKLIDVWEADQLRRVCADDEEPGKGQIRRATYDAYMRTAVKVRRELGELPIRNARSATKVKAAVDRASAGHYTVDRDMRRVLGDVFNTGIALEVLEANPVTALTPLPAPKRDTQTYDTSDVQLLRRIVREYETVGDRRVGKDGKRKGGRPREKYLANFVDLMLATGCRISEVLGLRWQDVTFIEIVDQDTGVTATRARFTIAGIAKTRKAAPGRPYLYWQPGPKTRQSRRTYTLGPNGTRLLQRLQAENTEGHEFVLSTRDGGMRAPANVRTALRKAAREAEAGLSASKTHTLRRTAATLVEERHGIGVSQLMLGHEEQSTTEVYVNRAREVPTLATDLLDDAIGVGILPAA